MLSNFTIYGSLRDFTNEQLVSYLNNNMSTEVNMMSGVLSEVLRRMNERSPLFPQENQQPVKKCKDQNTIGDKMNITPRKGWILVSTQEMEEKREGMLIIPGEDKKRTYLRVESEGSVYTKGQCLFAQPFKTKMKIEDNLFLIAEDDIVASFTFDDKK